MVLQSDRVNRGSRTVVVAPPLPGHKAWPFAVNLEPSVGNGLDGPRHLNLKQLRAVDVSRIGPQRVGRLEASYAEPIARGLALVLGLDG